MIGKQILLCVVFVLLLIVKLYKTHKSRRMKGTLSHVVAKPLRKCIFLGSEDGKIHVWNAESGMKVALLDGKHTGPITCLQFNPKFMTFASACSNMVSGHQSLPHCVNDKKNK